MNTSSAVSWGHWGQWGRSDAARAGAVPHGGKLLGTLWACRQFVPTAPRPNERWGQPQLPPLLAAPAVPTPATPKIKLVGRDWQTTNDSTSWS